MIEVMIAIVIASILVAVALPQFMNAMRKSRRVEAQKALTAVQQAQERERSRTPSYCSDLTGAPTVGTCGLNQASTTPNGYYTLAVTGADAVSYTATATAAGSQASDTNCAVLAVRMRNGGTLEYGSSSSATVDWTDANRCWAK